MKYYVIYDDPCGRRAHGTKAKEFDDIESARKYASSVSKDYRPRLAMGIPFEPITETDYRPFS